MPVSIDEHPLVWVNKYSNTDYLLEIAIKIVVEGTRTEYYFCLLCLC